MEQERNFQTSTDMLENAINSIKDSIQDEQNDITFYNMLLNHASDDEDILILKEIIENETRHNRLLRNVYFDLTGTTIQDTRSIYLENRCIREEALDNLKKAFFDELEAVKKYREIMIAMPDFQKYNILMEIMTDELRHASFLNYLITKYLHRKSQT